MPDIETEAITVRLPIELKRQLKAALVLEGITLTDWLRAQAEAWLKKR